MAYGKRRFEECIEDALKKAAVATGIKGISWSKFGHNEDAPDMELKYDVSYQSKEDMEAFTAEFNKNYDILQVALDPYEDTVNVLFYHWNSYEEGCLAQELVAVKDYCNKEGFEPVCSEETDLKFFNDEDFEWGLLEEGVVS